MKASIVDLRYRMKDVLLALRRNEEIQILYHGKTAGKIVPLRSGGGLSRVEDHPLFGSSQKSQTKTAVEGVLQRLRGGRFHAV